MQNSKSKMRALLVLSVFTGGSFTGANAQNQNSSDTFRDCETCPEMTVIPSGSITIGAYPDEAYRSRGERPKQIATIATPFAMASYEVTVGQYRDFILESEHQEALAMRNGAPLIGCNYFDGKGYGYVERHSWQDTGYPQRETEPVVCVSASDAMAYAAWLSEKTGKTYRVPSTVEFEYALRAGSNAPWPWGTDPSKACDYANIGDQTFGDRYPKRPQFGCDDGYLYTAKVGQFKPNAFGLYDMVGNAWEWTQDCWHDDLTDAPTTGEPWLEADGGDCQARVPKGGSWISGPKWARASVRSKDGLHYRSFMLGFRVARDMP